MNVNLLFIIGIKNSLKMIFILFLRFSFGQYLLHRQEITPIENFDILSAEKPYIYHRYATQVHPRSDENFYIYLKNSYQIDVKIQSTDHSMWLSVKLGQK